MIWHRAAVLKTGSQPTTVEVTNSAIAAPGLDTGCAWLRKWAKLSFAGKCVCALALVPKFHLGTHVSAKLSFAR
jgi:hypothetical protein